MLPLDITTPRRIVTQNEDKGGKQQHNREADKIFNTIEEEKGLQNKSHLDISRPQLTHSPKHQGNASFQ